MDDAAAALLLVSGLAVHYGGGPVLDRIDLTLCKGEILGLLGANGSGKSTFIKAITGQLRARGGTVTIDSIPLLGSPERAKARFGLAIDPADLPPFLSGRQYFELVASIRGCGPADWPAADLADRLALGAWIERPLAECSLGMRAKTAIAAALLGRPPLLIFDESLNGLDPLAAHEVKTLFAELAATGRHAVLVSTHVVEAVPGFCTRAVFLEGGRIVESWSAESLAWAARSPGRFEADVLDALRRATAADGAFDAGLTPAR